MATRAAQKRERNQGVARQKACLSVSEMQEIRRAIASEAATASPWALRDLAIFDTACELLASRAEIIRMRLQDLDLGERTVRCSGATGSLPDHGALFRISPRTAASIETWLAAAVVGEIDIETAGSFPVFVGVLNEGTVRRGPDGTPEPMDGRTMTRALQRYAAPLGISGVAGHSLRRTMARALYEAGVPEDEIVRKGRWASLDLMREYVGLTSPIQGASDLVF